MKKAFLLMVVTWLTANIAVAQSDRAQVARNYSELKVKAAKANTLRVIAKVKGTDKPKLRFKKQADRAQSLQNNAQKFANLKRHLGRHKIKHEREFERLGYMVLEVDETQLDELIDSGLVESVEEDIAVSPTLNESIPHIGADIAHASGYTGAGQTVVIFDTGVESSHPSFGGRVVEEACFSSNTTSASSLCPGSVEQLVGTGSADDCETSIRGCGHGTHVAGIAAGVDGVAPDANIVSVQVYSEFTAESCDSTITCVKSYSSDQLAAMEWVLNEAVSENIVSINMSLGTTTSYSTSCDTHIIAGAIADLRDAGIATVIAAGNNYSDTGVSSPGCISDAITVGSTYPYNDTLSGFSNSSELVDVLAPGSYILSSVVGGGLGSKSGTSMAAPHVAGAFAVLRSAKQSADVSAMEFSLEDTGVAVTDPANNVTKPRIDLNAAVTALILGNAQPQLLWPNGSDPVASSAQDGHPALNVGDDDLSTRWSAQYAGETITFDLGEIYNLSEIQIASLKGDTRNTYFDLAISSNGTSFTTVSTGVESSGNTTELESFDISGAARYVRIIGQGNSSNDWNSLTEVQIWGASGQTVEDELTAGSLASFEAVSSSQTLNISANIDWALTASDSWITVSPASGSGNGSSVVSVENNPSSEARQGSVTLSGGSISQTIIVTQAGEEVTGGDPVKLSISSVTASSDDGNVAENTLDEDLGTRWSANGDGQFATYDLGEIKSLSAIYLAFYKGDTRNTYFSVAVSDNGSDFTTVLVNESGSGESLSLESFSLTGQARYVRFIGHGNSSNTWNSVTEVELWGSDI